MPAAARRPLAVADEQPQFKGRRIGDVGAASAGMMVDDAAAPSSQPPAAEGGAALRKKKKSKSKMSQQQMSDVMPLILKTAAFLMQSTRDLESVAYDTFALPTDSLIVAAMGAKTKEWHAKAQEMGRGHKLGPPYLYAWAGLVETLAAEDVGQANRVALQLQKYNHEWDTDRLLLSVGSCRSKTMYDPTLTRVVVALRGELEEARRILLASLVQVGGEHKMGRAPPGGLERAIQRALDGE